MHTALIIGTCAFLSSFLGCFQVINLQRGHRWRLALSSVAIGVCQLSIYKLAHDVHAAHEVLAYVGSGLAGAQLAMCIRGRN